jgi:ubiquinone/menaquinone biosynthesis C-methylase UbiE
MPTSYPEKIPILINLIKKLRPKTIMDIGFGYGKYGFLIREYLREKDGANWQPVKKIDGIEAFSNYVSTIQKEIYDNIFIGDATNMEIKDYDLYLMIECIEHMNKEKALNLLDRITKKGKVIVTTPKKYTKQGEMHGNKYEKHISHWTKEDFKKYNPEDHSIKNTLILVI